jgi:glutathione-regulated potassium-efflux system ancillary protein KefF
VGRALAEAAAGLEQVEVRPLYSLYPDFWIDVAAEQSALLGATAIVWQSPIFWYSVPALLTLWFEKVLARGWAYGKGGHALRGKTCLWVTTTGAEESAYAKEEMHGFPFESFVPPIEQTARFCGMTWTPPMVVHGSAHMADDKLETIARRYRGRLQELALSSASTALALPAGTR